jgi:hypothetical protein
MSCGYYLVPKLYLDTHPDMQIISDPTGSRSTTLDIGTLSSRHKKKTVNNTDGFVAIELYILI